jgi:hypothetical protein
MSTTRKLKLTIGAVSLCLVACGGFLVNNVRQGDHTVVQLKVADRQQTLVAELVEQTESLVAGVGREEALAARNALGETITSFDEGLGALLAGGAVRLDGRAHRVTRVDNARAREALEAASQVWTDTGVPLGDLAAGQFSPFSAAGQEAVEGLQAHREELSQHMADAALSLRQGAAAQASLTGMVQWAAIGLGVALVALLAVVRISTWRANRPAKPARGKKAKAGQAHDGEDAAAPARPRSRAHIDDQDDDMRPIRSARPGGRPAVYVPSIDFDNVNAAVDQLSVDMNTIAGSSDKMRQAIDQVGFALQGMLYSLNEMAQDTSEGAQIVRNANNAAVFTADAATELVQAAREMSRLVGRVTQLAERTRHVAGNIEGEALQTGRTGEAFTSVVAQEVKGLARQTNQATFEIDQTVNDVLATARQYEEAIGQIIKNVAAINKVSQNLGQMMIDPPRRVQPGSFTTATAATAVAAQAMAAPAPAPVAPQPVAQPAPQPTIAQQADVQDDPVVVEPTAQQTAQVTAEAIEAATPAPAPTAAPAPAATAAEPAPTAPTPGPGKADGGSNGNVFLLGKPRRKPDVAAALAADAEATAPAAPAPAPAPVPAPVAEAPAPAPAPTPAPAPAASEAPATGTSSADGGSNRNVFLLNKPKGGKPAAVEAAAAAAPAPEAAMPVAAAPAAAPVPAPAPVVQEAPAEEAEEHTGPNIFMLTRPKKKTAPAEGGADAAVAVAEPVTVPPSEPAAPAAAPAATGDAPKKNFIMLNKPK